MIATMPIIRTGCTSTGGCYHASGITGMVCCSNCPSFASNVRSYRAEQTKREPAKKLTKGQKVREGLKNLPHNRKSMRY